MARLPELKILRVRVYQSLQWWRSRLADFKPITGLQYVEELEIGYIEKWNLVRRRYVLEKDGDRLVGYREI
jgi:hypothetical protein